MNLEEARNRALREIERRRQQLIQLSSKIHSHPEPGFQEVKAARWLSRYLEKNGFAVERGIHGLPTAFRATYGRGKPTIAFLAEYDALPKLGHACGHNLIGVASVAAGIAARPAVDRFGGTVLVMGTPSEESAAGKAVLLERGAFEGIDVALMIHPGSRDIAMIRALACQSLEVDFYGKAAHAASRPHQGVNALDALILSFNNLNALRQHLRERARLHGIITDGGQAPNIIPDHASGSFMVRAEDEGYLDELREKVVNCFQAAALATGCRLEYRWSPVRYAPLRSNRALAEAFVNNMQVLGRSMSLEQTGGGLGSTDMGNVSAVIPSLHPSIAIAPEDVSLHSLEFALAAASEAGQQGLLVGAKALALTAVNLLAQPELLARVREDFLRSNP